MPFDDENERIRKRIDRISENANYVLGKMPPKAYLNNMSAAIFSCYRVAAAAEIAHEVAVASACLLQISDRRQ